MKNKDWIGILLSQDSEEKKKNNLAEDCDFSCLISCCHRTLASSSQLDNKEANKTHMIALLPHNYALIDQGVAKAAKLHDDIFV